MTIYTSIRLKKKTRERLRKHAGTHSLEKYINLLLDSDGVLNDAEWLGEIRKLLIVYDVAHDLLNEPKIQKILAMQKQLAEISERLEKRRPK